MPVVAVVMMTRGTTVIVSVMGLTTVLITKPRRGEVVLTVIDLASPGGRVMESAVGESLTR